MRNMNVAYSRVLGIESEGEVFAGYLKGEVLFYLFLCPAGISFSHPPKKRAKRKDAPGVRCSAFPSLIKVT